VSGSSSSPSAEESEKKGPYGGRLTLWSNTSPESAISEGLDIGHLCAANSSTSAHDEFIL
jgi:hypothetical protein